MLKISKALLEDLLLAAKNTFPNEFFAMIAENDKGIIDEFVVIPATFGKRSVWIRGWGSGLRPMDKSIAGSAHSHPTPNATPSRADLKQFGSYGKIHLILAYPFDLNSIKAFNVNGKTIEFEMVP